MKMSLTPVRDSFLVLAEKADAHLHFMEAKLKEQGDEAQKVTDTEEFQALRSALNSLSRRVAGGAYKEFLVCAEMTRLRLQRANVTGPAPRKSSEDA